MFNVIKSRIAKVFIVLLASVMLTIIAPLAAMATTTADIVVTADPSYIAITNTPNTWVIGAVTAGVNKNTTGTYFTANNTGSVTSNITITAILTAGNWSGGQGWVHSNTATAGADQAGLISSIDSWTTNVTVASTAAWLKTGLAAATTQTWGMALMSPTSFSDGVQKTMTVRLTIYQQ
jgi:hypothetical protein